MNTYRMEETARARLSRVSIVLSTVMMLSPLPAAAQSPVLEEIIVTAQKREQSLQDVSISITQFSANDIARLGADDFRDLDGFMPNVVQTGLNSGIEPNITIRGISSQTRNSGFDSGASMYVDGVYVGRPTAFFANLADVESLEVLRGPQGTLFGKNTIAGAINATTQQPGEEFNFSVEGRAGNYSERYARIAASGPLSDSFFAGFSYFNHQRDGFQDNIGTGREQGDKDDTGWRLNLRYEASENLEFILSADEFEDDSRQPIFVITNGLGADCCGGDLFTVETNIDPRIEREFGGQSLTINYDLQSGGRITSISAFRDNEISFIGDSEGTALDFLQTEFIDEEEQFTQELRYASADDSAVPFVIGVYYYDQEVETDRVSIAGPDLNTLFGIPPFIVFDPIDLKGAIETEAFAVFGHAEYALTDRISMNVGLRYTEEERELTRFNLIGNPGFGIGTFDMTQVADSTVDESAISWNIGATFHLNESMNTYLKASRGFKSGGFNLEFVGVNDFALEFDPEYATTYEWGFKSVLMEDRVRLNAAIFQTDYEDLQISRFVTPPGATLGSFTIDNAAEAKITGLEVELRANITAGFMLSATVGLLDTEFEDFDPGADDFSGNEFASAPEKTFSLLAQYTHDFANGLSLYVLGSYTYRDQYYDDPDNMPATVVDSNDLTNARIGLTGPEDNWTIELYGNNLSDEEYVTGYSNPPTGLGVNMGEPRTYGLRLLFEI